MQAIGIHGALASTAKTVSRCRRAGPAPPDSRARWIMFQKLCKRLLRGIGHGDALVSDQPSLERERTTP